MGLDWVHSSFFPCILSRSLITKLFLPLQNCNYIYSRIYSTFLDCYFSYRYTPAADKWIFTVWYWRESFGFCWKKLKVNFCDEMNRGRVLKIQEPGFYKSLHDVQQECKIAIFQPKCDQWLHLRTIWLTSKLLHWIEFINVLPACSHNLRSME